MTKMLVQLQLSNYDKDGTFILEADSGFQMMFGRIREMMKLNSSLKFDILIPCRDQLRTQPEDIVPDLFKFDRINLIEIHILPNALATRYDFDFFQIEKSLDLKNSSHQKYDIVYINDPMLFRNYKALFYMNGYLPKFIVHSHFIDNPSCPKFPKEASLWLGQCEAALGADYNFWQCESAMKVFLEEFANLHRGEATDFVESKSSPWDDGYSREEITSDYNLDNVRFTVEDFLQKTKNKVIIFVPNRIGGKGRSSDYTNCGKFMFEILPQLYKASHEYVVIAGNPSQKFSNDELVQECGPHGFINLVPDALNRDEFKFIAKHSDIAVGFYDADAYGGTAARECVELGCLPFWLDVYEYKRLAKEAKL